MKKIIVLIAIIVVTFIASYLIYREGTLPVNKDDKTNKIFVISKGESISTIAQHLANEGLIRNRVIFYAVVKQKGYDKKIQAGDFRLSPSMNLYQLSETLTHGTLDKWVTVIEGLRKEEIAQIVAKEFDIPESEFIKDAPEGYLFPDTYLIPRDASVSSIVQIMTNNFSKKLTPDLIEKGRKLNLTKEQMITLASIVEREAQTPEDKQKVASVLLKRIRSDWPLQSDITIQYILGYQPKEKTWWKKDIYYQDLEIESPYNTYKNKGLPPAPVCNPGLTSIEGVANADSSTPYYFYIADKQGVMHYARTKEEHDKNVEKYLK
jgi:UPF0755 protein